MAASPWAVVREAQAYHIVREALINARRHAQAQHVQITVERYNGLAQFTIADDGGGFDPTGIDGRHHLGLSIMRTRAERCGGTLEVKSEPGHGTQIVARLPLLEPRALLLASRENPAARGGRRSSALSLNTQERG